MTLYEHTTMYNVNIDSFLLEKCSTFNDASMILNQFLQIIMNSGYSFKEIEEKDDSVYIFDNNGDYLGVATIKEESGQYYLETAY